jgi:Zn-dependent M28 family amino/carboxypeptidase
MICFIAAALFALAAVPPPPEAKSWWSHVQYLASDKLQGRNAGSPGHKLAADYVAAQFKKAGLAPCGDGGGYLQAVPLVTKRLIEPESSLSITAAHGQIHRLVLGDDAMLSTRVNLPESLEAPAVFLGYGLAIPGEGGAPGYDDFAGQDVRGKLLVTISGSPANLPGPLRAHFSSAAERAKILAVTGAAGVLSIVNPKTSDVPWDRSSAARLLPSMSIDDPVLSGERGPSLAATLNPAKVAWLFDGAPEPLGSLLEMATAGKPLPHFPLNATVQARAKVEQTKLASQNVCGVMTGASKPGESVVLSAHIDHLGADPQARGTDKIYNGAMDNASGIATLIETARLLNAARAKPARSIVFVAVTAEEKGLLGSRYFANRAPAAAGTMVADINFDMFLPIHVMKKIMALGLDESSLKKPLEEVTARLGLGLQGDLEPQRNRFIRSDQYSFIQRGIPSLALKVGYEPGSPEADLQKQWIANRYHALSDDLSQPVDLEAAAMFNRVIRALAMTVANAPERPTWNAESFFRRFAAPAHEATSGGRD